MNIGRIFANAIVRRVAFLLVAAAFAWMGIGRASAAQYPDQGVAYATCMSENDYGTYCNSRGGPGSLSCPHYNPSATVGGYRQSKSCANGQSTTLATPEYLYIKATGQCSSRSDEYSWQVPAGGGNQNRCSGGCMYSFVFDASGNFYGPTGSVCTVADAPAPALDTDGDDVPDDQDAFPNDPNESADSDGDGIGDNADIAPDDPDNGEDEGEGNETDNSASGGGDCNAPPTCKGDGIACNTNFQVWKLRCQGTAHGSVTGNVQDCNQTITVVSPDPIANAQLLALRKIACTEQGGGTGSGDGFGTGDSDNLGTIADAVRGDGEPDNSIGPEEPGDAWFGEGDGEVPTEFDESGYGFTRTCPTIPPISVFGNMIEFDIGPLCEWSTLGGYIVVALAGLACVRIISGRAA